MVIAATLFWAVAFLISVVYIKTPEKDLTLHDGQITNAFELRQQQRLQRGKERRMRASERKQARQQSAKGGHRGGAVDDIESYADGDTEVRLG